MENLTPEPLMKMMAGLWAGKAFSVATELDIFTLLHEKGMTLKEVSEKLSIPLRPAEMLLNSCVSMELLSKEQDSYMNTPVSDRFLVKGLPGYYGSLVIMLGTRLSNEWNKLKDCVLNNKSVNPTGDILDITGDPEKSRMFTEAMHSNSTPVAMALAELIGFSGFKGLLDVGGGSGAYPIVITGRYPGLKAVVFDDLCVCDIAQEFIKNTGASSRVDTCPGNFWTDPFPEGADSVLLGHILHGFNEEKNRILLKKIYDYLPRGGTVIIVEFLLNENKTGPLFSTLFGLNMLIETEDGRTYSESEINKMLVDTGFGDIKSKIPLFGPQSVIYGRKL